VKRGLYIVGGLIAVAVIFQLFFRYQYIHQLDLLVLRIDRLTGQSCVLGGDPYYIPNPCERPTKKQNRARVIRIVSATEEARSIVATAGANYHWTVQDAFSVAIHANPPSKGNNATPSPVDGLIHSRDIASTYLVCYCDRQRQGWRWEAHLLNEAVYSVDDDAILLKRYGIIRKQEPIDFEPLRSPVKHDATPK
jgi:hypothetical protein